MDDLRITGGLLVDPATGRYGSGDVAVVNGVIRAVGRLDAEPAREVVDASGLLVTPGLIDMHTHFYPEGTFWGIHPDPVAWYSGVTTWVDAGSVGAFGLDGLLEARRKFQVHSAILLHIAAHGLAARTGESRDLADLDSDAALSAIRRHRDVVRGIKVRMDSSTVGENYLEPLRVALQTGEMAEVPVMVHIGDGPFRLDEVVDMLRPGDIITHCAGKGASGIAESGPVRDSLRRAYERGVVFDIGHGAGGFSFDVVESYLEQGMPPHVISTDLHVLSANGPAFDLPTVMSKLMAVGMSLKDVFAATTITPARVLGLPAGQLAPGAPADIALFDRIAHEVVLGDVHGIIRVGNCSLRAKATYVDGYALPPAFPQQPPSWVSLSTAQQSALSRRKETLRAMLSEPLVDPSQVMNQIPGAASEN